MKEKMGFFIRKSESGQNVGQLLPLLEIAVTLITRNGRILTVFNEKWGSFTLPMSKRRVWKDPQAKDGSERVEEWESAAIRAAVEWLGRTVTEAPKMVADVAEFQQSDRDERWKRYRMQVFQFEVDGDVSPAAGRPVEWLESDDIVDETRRPISPTARHVVAELKLKGLV